MGLEAGWNTYAYVAGNPVSAVDYLGLDMLDVHMKVSRGISWVDQKIVDGLTATNAPAMPQGVVDFTAGWGDVASLSLTEKIRGGMGNNTHVRKGSSEYGFGGGCGAVNAALMAGYGGAAGAIKVGQIGVPKGMVKVTRWGREGLKDGDWVMVGGKNKLTWTLSGRQRPYDTGSTHIVPKGSLASPLKHRPSNEPPALANTKNFFGINMVQKVYKP